MLTLSKKTDYALIALVHLAEHRDRPVSAREIAATHDLPAAMLMNILKSLHQHDLLKSTRGTKGGYRLAGRLHEISLYDLIEIIDGPVRMTECVVLEEPSCDEVDCCRISLSCPIQAPLKALHHRLVRFLKEVKLTDLLLPGTRIDVPLEAVRMG